LFIGDIVGKPGREILRQQLANIQEKFHIDFTVANGENAAGGAGINKKIFDEISNYGVDVVTMGNHVWDKKEITQFIDHEPNLVRPANYPPETPGRGSYVIKIKNNTKIGIINLSGRVFLPPLDCPFRTADAIVKEMRKETPIIIIDFHGEATSEKMAFGWFMDGRVSAVIGTHTHIQTADDRILPQGTGYITDVGMTGPRDSVLGVDKDLVIQKFMTALPVRFDVAAGNTQINAVLLKVEENTGKCVHIERIQKTYCD
jgi:metallophosphoesterase (TIGR00282 family)